MSLNIVLVEPEIPQNTGNIARTCAATGSKLHLVRPLGFAIDDSKLKRAGLDYWHLLDIEYHDSFEALQESYPEGNYFFSTTKAKQKHTDVKYSPNCFIVFGKETAGLPRPLIDKNIETCIRIPMINDASARSLNLSNSVAVVVFEALRQIGFPNMI
jgi:tRNA (cytidine/uridine-2'-O-)-methyltransferase